MEGGVFPSHREQEEAEGADNKSWNILGVQGSSSIAAVRESGAVGRGDGFIWAGPEGSQET